MNSSEKTKKPIVLYLGIILVLFSLISFYFLNSISSHSAKSNVFEKNGLYFMHYVIALFYFILIIVNSFIQNKWKFSKIDRRHFIIAIILLSISSFSINRPIPIFSEYPLWVKIYLALAYVPLIIYCLPEKFKSKLRFLASFLTGCGLIITLYFSIYLAPLYPFGFIGLLLLGITATMFAPAFTFTTLIVQFIKEKPAKIDSILLVSGLIIPIAITILFLGKYHTINKQIHEARAATITRPQNNLPDWVLISQKLSDDTFTQMVIKGRLFYDHNDFLWGNWGFPSNSFSENKLHDPLMVIGQTFVNDLNLDSEERINILKLQDHNRHLAHRKLWSGKYLTTSNVLTNIDIYPAFRLAYLEKYLNIKNNSNSSWSEQEALYTFYLPEGAIVTSMSLWIDGKEEKSRLTSKSKADSAYVTIVGRERRDPALLHWQEGNRVTLTIFPCTPKKERKVKIGFTIPLEKNNENLVLNNVKFEGPESNLAMETTIIRFPKTDMPVSKLKGFEYMPLDNYFKYEGKYRENWTIELPKIEASEKVFTHEGYSYSIKDYTPEKVSFSPETIFLDINKSWTKQEYLQVCEIFAGKTILVYKDALIKVSEANKNEVFSELNKINFSLFPFYKVSTPEKSLVISKSTDLSPDLNDLEGSGFSDNLNSYFQESNKRIPFYSLNKVEIPYLKTINQFDLINYQYGNLDLLKKYISNKEFPAKNENKDKVVLVNSKLQIERHVGENPSEAPDHLYRIFNYQKILSETSGNYFNSSAFVTDKLLSMANDAYVVSPVSSLIVLETQADYERFDIKENNSGLKNAFSESTGAAPEPHEWALIILLSLILGWAILRKKYPLKFKTR